MSAAPISEAEVDAPAPVRAALQRAGWPVAAWAWERAAVAALEAVAEGAVERARTVFARAQAVAQDTFPAEDLRLVVAAANVALLAGDREALNRLSAQWNAGECWCATLRPDHSGARSSLFHMRLAAKHRGAYAPLAADRIARRWQEGRDALAAAQRAAGLVVDYREGARAQLARWSGAAARLGFTDERKLAAAAALLLRSHQGPDRATVV